MERECLSYVLLGNSISGGIRTFYTYVELGVVIVRAYKIVRDRDVIDFTLETLDRRD